MHTRLVRSIPYVAAFLLTAALLIFVRVDAAALSFTEDFSATRSRDATSTAAWDTAAKAVRLPSVGAAWGGVSALNGVSVTAMAFSPTYASDRIAFVGTSNGIYRTTDGGTTWNRVATTAKEVTRIALAPAFASDRVGFAITNGDGLWKTTDSGATWASADAGMNGFGVAFSPEYTSDRTVFAAMFAGIRKSTDGGATWSDANSGIDAAAIENGDLRGVAVSRAYASDRTLFATTVGSGVYRSTDAGATWTAANPTDLTVPYATVIATGPDNVVAAAFLDGAYRSADNGSTWARIYSGDVTDIAFVPSGSERAVFLVTEIGPQQWSDDALKDVATGWSGSATTIGAWSTNGATAVIAGQSSGASLARTTYAESALAVSTAVDDTADRIVSATLTVTALLPPGTSIAYHLSATDGDPTWEGPIVPGTPWTFTATGSTLRWRVTLATTDTAATPTVTRVELAYETEIPLPPPEPTSSRASTSSIRWSFTDAAADETGFEIHVGEHGSKEEKVVVTTKPDAAKDLAFLEELGLQPNTEYCNRHAHTLRGTDVSQPSTAFPCRVTLAAIPPSPTASDVAETTAVLRLGIDVVNPVDTVLAIRETKSGKYVGSDGAFGDVAVWRTRQGWGDGTVSAAGLIAATDYTFCVIARNRVNVETACSNTAAVKTLTAKAPPVVEEPKPGAPKPTEGTTTDGSTAPPVTPTDSTSGAPRTSPEATSGRTAPPTEEVRTAPPVEGSTGRTSPPVEAEPARGAVGTAAVVVEPVLIITAPADGQATSAVTIVVSGRTEPSTTLALTVDGSSFGTMVSAVGGEFSAALPSPLSEGAHVVLVTASFSDHAPLSASVSFTVDRTPPPPPVITAARSVERAPSTTRRDDAFNVTFEVSGSLTAAEFAELDVLILTVSSEPVTFTFRPSAPNWLYRNTTSLEPGAHTVRVAARDRAGNISPLPQVFTFVVPPAACGDSVDNDGDTLVDYPNDPDCRNVVDDNEATEGVVTRAVTAVKEVTVESAKVVAITTVAAAQATAKTAERTAVVVQERVLDNPTVEVATERVIAPTVAVAVVANTATAAQGFQFLTYLRYLIGLLVQPSRLLGRRRRRSWGTVYASIAKRPLDLATVRLTDAVTGKVAQTAVTDHLGRYQFAVKRAGTYRLDVVRQGYAFPSALLKGKKEDTAFTDLYHGEPLAVEESGAFIAANIPLDAREQQEVPEAKVVRRHYLRIVSAGVSAGGLVLSFVSFSISPRPYVAVILAVNILLYFLFRRMAAATRRPKSWGSIADVVTQSPLHLAIVRLFDTEFNKLLETAVTDRFGRYSFLVGKNAYYVTAQKPPVYGAEKSDTIDLTGTEGVVGVDLRLKRAERAK